MKATNREIARAFHFSLPQVRRWAVLVLGKDPEADKGGGVPRGYDLDSAFKVYLAGILIRYYRIPLKEIQSHLKRTGEFLEKQGLLPSQLGETNKIPLAQLTIFSGNRLRLQIEVEEQQIIHLTNSGEKIRGKVALHSPDFINSYFDVKKHYKEIWYPLNIPFPPKRGPQWVIDLTMYLERFVKQSKSNWSGER